jgi:hypothetical protein
LNVSACTAQAKATAPKRFTENKKQEANQKMKRQVLSLGVYTDNDFIFIEQPDTGEISLISVSAEQVPLLIHWLQEAVAELSERTQKQ